MWFSQCFQRVLFRIFFQISRIFQIFLWCSWGNLSENVYVKILLLTLIEKVSRKCDFCLIIADRPVCQFGFVTGDVACNTPLLLFIACFAIVSTIIDIFDILVLIPYILRLDIWQIHINDVDTLSAIIGYETKTLSRDTGYGGTDLEFLLWFVIWGTEKDLGRFIIQICPTYNDERCSRHMLIKINIYCQYIILTIWKHDTFCWMTTTFIEKNW